MTTAPSPNPLTVHRTLRRLAQLPDLAVEVWLTWGAPNPSNRSERGRRGPVTGSPAPTDLTALDLLRRGDHVPTRSRPGADDWEVWEDAQQQSAADRCLDQLLDQAHRIRRDLADEQREALYPIGDTWVGDTWVDVCAWLANTYDRWQRCDTLLADTFALIDRVHGWLSQAARVRPELILHCTLCDDALVGVGPDGESVPLEQSIAARCPTCGRVHTYDARLEQLGHISELTLDVLAAEIDRDPALLRKWAERGLITPTGQQAGRKLYSVDQVKSVAAKLDLHGERRCEACGKRFAPAKPRARHCSPTCRKRAHRAATRRHAVTPDVPLPPTPVT